MSSNPAFEEMVVYLSRSLMGIFGSVSRLWESKRNSFGFEAGSFKSKMVCSVFSGPRFRLKATSVLESGE